MKHVTRAQRPHGTRSEYAKGVPICAPGERAVRWGVLVTIDEAQTMEKSALCPVCVAAWVDIRLTKRREQWDDDKLIRFIHDNFDDEQQGPSLAESVHL